MQLVYSEQSQSPVPSPMMKGCAQLQPDYCSWLWTWNAWWQTACLWVSKTENRKINVNNN